MYKSRGLKPVVFFMFSLFLSFGCAAMRGDISARFYELKKGEVIQAQLKNFGHGQGRITAIMPDGEEMKGEYIITVPRKRPVMPVTRPIPVPLDKNASDQKAASDTESPGTEKAQELWPSIYGFGPNAEAVPAGSATLVGGHGTVLEIVFYAASLIEGYADGVAQDNKGRRYRVHVGQLAE